MPLLLTLRPGREKSVLKRHPWLFDGGVAHQDGDPSDGLVRVVDSRGSFLAWGLASPRAGLLARLISFDAEIQPSRDLFRSRLEAALRLRECLLPPDTTGWRAINAEGDGLPGLVVDRYGDGLVVQASTEGMERVRPLWLPPLLDLLKPAWVLQKNNLPTRRMEGLTLDDEPLHGQPPEGMVPFREHGMWLQADVGLGQKTGFFLDQRDNRHLVRRLAPGRRVLDLFCYAGGFGASALLGGAARALEVDVSTRALDLARQTRVLNDLSSPPEDFVAADVSQDLRHRVQAGERWDLVIVDPPAFVKKQADVDRGLRGYKDVNRLAMRLLAPGGLLLSCSCSGLVSPDLFQKVLFGARLDAGVPLRLLERRGAGVDHPVSIDCPEGEYLKVFLLQRMEG